MVIYAALAYVALAYAAPAQVVFALRSVGHCPFVKKKLLDTRSHAVQFTNPWAPHLASAGLSSVGSSSVGLALGTRMADPRSPCHWTQVVLARVRLVQVRVVVVLKQCWLS